MSKGRSPGGGGWGGHHTMTFLTCDCEAVPMKKTFAQKM